MRIALLGSRGIPARYSGFETFYEELATRLVHRGHEVTVYNRSGFLPDVKREYRGVRIVSLPSIRSKHLDTFSHTLLSSLHTLLRRYDIACFVIVGNSPLVWIPRLRGTRVLLNVDGQDWAREKWSGFARWYQRRCEWLAARLAPVIIADARVIQRRYRDVYGADTVFVPYGANIRKDAGTDALRKWGLEPDKYILYVGRFVPENAIDLLVRAFREVKTDRKLVVVGDAPYSEEYRAQVRALADERVVFTGYAFGADYAQLSSHAYLYVQPSGVDGTRPALLDQLGFGNCVLVRDSPANMEVIAECGCLFDRTFPLESLKGCLGDLLSRPDIVTEYRAKAPRRITEYYNWEWIADFYEDLFRRLLSRETRVSYDDYLKGRGLLGSGTR